MNNNIIILFVENHNDCATPKVLTEFFSENNFNIEEFYDEVQQGKSLQEMHSEYKARSIYYSQRIPKSVEPAGELIDLNYQKLQVAEQRMLFLKTLEAKAVKYVGMDLKENLSGLKLDEIDSIREKRDNNMAFNLAAAQKPIAARIGYAHINGIYRRLIEEKQEHRVMLFHLYSQDFEGAHEALDPKLIINSKEIKNSISLEVDIEHPKKAMLIINNKIQQKIEKLKIKAKSEELLEKTDKEKKPSVYPSYLFIPRITDRRSSDPGVRARRASVSESVKTEPRSYEDECDSNASTQLREYDEEVFWSDEESDGIEDKVKTKIKIKMM